jgi:transposase
MNLTPYTWKEARRLQAWHLKQQGWSQRQIAQALGVSEGAVSQWMPRLPELLHRGPTAYGFRGELWTRSRVAAVIRLEFGVSYHPRHVGRLLAVLRWSPQKPARRARQRNEAAITQWRDETWPAIKRGRRPTGKPSSL